MSKTNTTCRVCGKQYFCCDDSRSIHSWRTMACSTDCYKEYMNRIEMSRNHISESFETNSSKPIVKTPKIRNHKSPKEGLKTEDMIKD